MSRGQRLTMHGRDHRPKGFFGKNDPGGADPIAWPRNLLVGVGTITEAVTAPGGLIFRYQMADALGAGLADTSAWPGGPTDMTYTEVTTGVDPLGGAQSTWDGTQAVTRVVDHPQFADGDDGSVKFNYKQLHNGNGVDHPGAYFSASSALFTWSSSLKSIGFWFKPDSNGLIGQEMGIISKSHFSSLNDGFNGWAFTWIPRAGGNGDFSFVVENGGGPPARSFSLAPGGSLPADVWYRVCVTKDITTHVWTLMIDGLVIATYTDVGNDHDPADGGGMFIGRATGFNGSFGGGTTYNSYFLGEVDEVGGYNVTLTLDQERAIVIARGAGLGTTVDTVTIGAGNPGIDPGAIGSGSSAQYEVLQSNGDGTTAFGRARILTYQNGA